MVVATAERGQAATKAKGQALGTRRRPRGPRGRAATTSYADERVHREREEWGAEERGRPLITYQIKHGCEPPIAHTDSDGLTEEDRMPCPLRPRARGLRARADVSSCPRRTDAEATRCDAPRDGRPARSVIGWLGWSSRRPRERARGATAVIRVVMTTRASGGRAVGDWRRSGGSCWGMNPPPPPHIGEDKFMTRTASENAILHR